MTVLIAVVALLIGMAVGWMLRSPSEDTLALPSEAFARALAEGRLPPESDDELAEVRRAIAAEWAPKNEERDRALQQALGRIAAFLRTHVKEPLSNVGATDSPEALRQAVGVALGGLEDLEFFLREPLTPDETHDIVPLVQQVTREFTSDWQVAVRMSTDGQAVRAHIHRDTFLDALYLLLHNAGQFGEGKTIDVAVMAENRHAVIRIADQGPGFSPDALHQAEDLFFTTTDAGLGLGIPFARKIVESFGGDIAIANREQGGAEVTLRLPLD